MQTAELLVLQFVLSLAAYAAIGVLFIWPWLRGKPDPVALSILLLPQLFRHVGVTLLVPEVVDPTLPDRFARHTAIGDTLTVALAWVALVSLRVGWRWAIPTVWVFNLLGLADMLFNLSLAVRLGVADHLGAAWYGPAFVVPGMLVVHGLIFATLIQRWRDSGLSRAR